MFLKYQKTTELKSLGKSRYERLNHDGDSNSNRKLWLSPIIEKDSQVLFKKRKKSKGDLNTKGRVMIFKKKICFQ